MRRLVEAVIATLILGFMLVFVYLVLEDTTPVHANYERCDSVCAPYYVYSASGSKCVCDKTKEVR